ncbi:MAG: RecX family transcriptional regulator [Acholeplasmatales bacterium]|nr:RecX family transcriptional regulator [Acholeplasmatales bacterium]
MIIDSVTKSKKKSVYVVAIGNKTYEFNEDIIIEFNLYKGKEISDGLLNKALASNSLNDYYNKALNYALRYYKSSYDTKNYLKEKGLSNELADEIVNKLIEKNIINDKKIVENSIFSLVKSCNGKLLIIEKLKQKRFDINLINECVNNIDMDFYFESLNKLYEKVKNKYDKYPDYVRIGKLKGYLYSRGYSTNDISILEIK